MNIVKSAFLYKLHYTITTRNNKFHPSVSYKLCAKNEDNNI